MRRFAGDSIPDRKQYQPKESLILRQLRACFVSGRERVGALGYAGKGADRRATQRKSGTAANSARTQKATVAPSERS
jgi:hypothetical protein